MLKLSSPLLFRAGRLLRATICLALASCVALAFAQGPLSVSSSNTVFDNTVAMRDEINTDIIPALQHPNLISTSDIRQISSWL